MATRLTKDQISVLTVEAFKELLLGKVFPVYDTEVLGSPPAKRAKAARPHMSRQEITQAPGERKTARAEEMHAKWMARLKRKLEEEKKKKVAYLKERI